MTKLKSSAAAWLAPLTGLNEKELYQRLEYPPDEEMGDLSLPCFPLAKELRRSPSAIAQELAARLNSGAAADPPEGTGGHAAGDRSEQGASRHDMSAETSIQWRAEALGGYLNLLA